MCWFFCCMVHLKAGIYRSLEMVIGMARRREVGVARHNLSDEAEVAYVTWCG